MPWQGLRWMVGLRLHGLNGILADEMGLGKTLMVRFRDASGQIKSAQLSVSARR